MQNLGAIQSFIGNPIPKIVFGSGSVAHLAHEICMRGKYPLLVTGERSFITTPAWDQLIADLKGRGVNHQTCQIGSEPDVEMIDQELSRLRQKRVDIVVGIGGGSAVDAAKAFAGMLPVSGSIAQFLEGLPE